MLCSAVEFIDFALAFNHSVYFVIRYLLALPLGWEREQSDRHSGFRTIPLVVVVICGFCLLGFSVIDNTAGEARIIQGIIT